MSGGLAGLSIACALYLLFAVTCAGSVADTQHLPRLPAGQRVSLQHAPSAAHPDTSTAAAAARRLARRLLQQLQLQLPLISESGRGPYTLVDSSANPRKVFNSSSSAIGQAATPVPPSSSAPWSVGFPRFSASPVMQSVGLMAAGFVGGAVALWSVNYLRHHVDWEQDWQGQLLASLPAPLRNNRWVAALEERRRQHERRQRRLQRVESLLREGQQQQAQQGQEGEEEWRLQLQQQEEEEAGRERGRASSAPHSRTVSRGDRGAAEEAGGGQADLRGGGVQGEAGRTGAAGERHGGEALQHVAHGEGMGGTGPLGEVRCGGRGGAAPDRSCTACLVGEDCAGGPRRYVQLSGVGRRSGGLGTEGSEAGAGELCREAAYGEAGALAGPSGWGSGWGSGSGSCSESESEAGPGAARHSPPAAGGSYGAGHRLVASSSGAADQHVCGSCGPGRQQGV